MSIPVPEWFLVEMKKCFLDFLWDGKPPRVRNDVICNDYCDGGLRMVNIDNYITAQRIAWTKHFLNEKTTSHQMLQTFINLKVTDFLNCSMLNPYFTRDIHPFYYDILKAWFSSKDIPKSVKDIQMQVIWYNKYILIENKTTFNKSAYDMGICYIQDIIDRQGNFLKYADVIDRFGQCLKQFEYMSIIDAIPAHWRKALKNNYLPIIEPSSHLLTLYINRKAINITKEKSKQIYLHLNSKEIQKPSCLNNWFEKYFFDYEYSKWKKIFCLSKFLTKDTKIIEFQFKILHRVYATDSYVSNFDSTVSKHCLNCNIDNNIIHTFTNCIKVTTFWKNFETWLSRKTNRNFSVNIEYIIFGIIDGEKQNFYLDNFLILHAKWFIHIQKLNSCKPCLENFFYAIYIIY